MSWLPLFLALFSAEARAITLREACTEFAQGDQSVVRKCMLHAESFELNGEFVAAVNKFSGDPDTRMKTLKSGANLEILGICRRSGWKMENTLSCMRSYPTEEIMKACKAISPNEEEQLRCVRIGREPPQVKACIAAMQTLANRFECIENDLPVAEARDCSKKHADEKLRAHCIEMFVAKRDGTYFHDDKSRALASHPAPGPQK